jgi:hypothetical protein
MFNLMLVSRTWNGKRTLKHRGSFETRELANAEKNRLLSMPFNDADYRVLGPRQLTALRAEIKAEQDERRKAGAKKAAATRKARGPGNFIKCPTCGAKSKKLFSEFGGLQTRVCQRGHRFEHDKWLADRAFWAPILTGRVIPESRITRPLKPGDYNY